MEQRDIIKRLQLPEYKVSFRMTHNEHKEDYQDAKSWIEENEWCDWESEEAKAEAIKTDQVWTVRWYAHTPVGFFAVAAPTLFDALRLANEEF